MKIMLLNIHYYLLISVIHIIYMYFTIEDNQNISISNYFLKQKHQGLSEFSLLQ